MRNLAVILITHDMGVISETADRVAVMKNGDLGRDWINKRNTYKSKRNLYKKSY